VQRLFKYLNRFFVFSKILRLAEYQMFVHFLFLQQRIGSMLVTVRKVRSFVQLRDTCLFCSILTAQVKCYRTNMQVQNAYLLCRKSTATMFASPPICNFSLWLNLFAFY
jgi:hypothetical protein